MNKIKVLIIAFFCLCFNVFGGKNGFGEPPQPAETQTDRNVISLDVKNINLEDALRLIADQSGLNIVTSRNVRGTITVKLKDVPIEDALKAILGVNNCKYIKEDNIIKIYTYQDIEQEERFLDLKTKVYTLKFAKAGDVKNILLTMKSARGKVELNPIFNQLIISDTLEAVKEMEEVIGELDRESQMRVFELNYADPNEMQTKLSQLIPKIEGEVMVDVRTNSIIVKAAPLVQDEVEILIKKWDRQSQQVQIEAKIIEVTLDDTFKLGVNWNYVAPASVKKKREPASADLKGDFSLDLTEGGVFKVGTLSADDYIATLEMLSTKTDTDILSSPKITVLDGQKASILVGSNEPYTVSSQDPVTGFVTEQTNFMAVGIKLIVSPKIGRDDHVTMTIHPEVSTARRVAEADNALAVDTTQADTTLTVKNGETVVLGGLMKQEKTKTTKKIPILGDIPVLGLVFRSKEEENVKKELIVFITPYILNSQGKVVHGESLEEEEMKKVIQEIINKVQRRKEYQSQNSFEQD